MDDAIMRGRGRGKSRGGGRWERGREGGRDAGRGGEEGERERCRMRKREMTAYHGARVKDNGGDFVLGQAGANCGLGLDELRDPLDLAAVLHVGMLQIEIDRNLPLVSRCGGDLIIPGTELKVATGFEAMLQLH
jgi:hypothetical protein